MDRGIDYRELIEYLSECQVRHIILMEATGKRIYQEIYKFYPEFKDRPRLILAEHLEDGVRQGHGDYQAGTQLRAFACSRQLWYF